MTKPLQPPFKSCRGGYVYATNTHRESYDNYVGVIVYCRDGWRVIIDKTSSQYVAQKRSSSTNTGVWRQKPLHQ